MSYKLEDFIYISDNTLDKNEWVKNNISDNPKGGYLIPDTIQLPVKGFMGKFWRLLKNKRGWYDYHLYDELIKQINRENYGSEKREDRSA